MFQRFSDQARRVLVLAQEAARERGHDAIGTEHLLIGLLLERGGVVARVLEAEGVSLEQVSDRVAAFHNAPARPTPGSPPFSPRAKQVLELSLREALLLDHNYVGPEHLLLGVTRQSSCVAYQILDQLGVDVTKLRTQVIERVPGRVKEEGGESRADGQRDREVLGDVVREVGLRLRGDLSDAQIDRQTADIVAKLLEQLRQWWAEANGGG